MDFIIEMEALGDPLAFKDVRDLAMELMKGTKVEQDLLAFQKTRRLCPPNATAPSPLSYTWYTNFLDRHNYVIESKRPLAHAVDRFRWGTKENLDLVAWC